MDWKLLRPYLPALLAGVWCAVSALAQVTEGAKGFSDRSEVEVVLVTVSVSDLKGRPVPDLERKAFHLFIDGLEFPFSSFWREAELPLSLCLVVDVSGSMAGQRLARVRESVRELLAGLRPADEVSLVTFGAGEVRRRVPFGADPSLVLRVLESLEGFGSTALFDTVAGAPELTDGARHARRAVLLFTDGVDTASTMTAEEAAAVLEEMADPLYAFGIEPPPPEDGVLTYEGVLARLSQASGGRYIRVEKANELAALARELRRQLGTRYLLTFQPSGKGMEKFRRIRVAVDGPYQVRAREGYVGTLP